MADQKEMTPEMQQLMGKFMRSQSQREKDDKIERYKHLNKYVRKGQIVFTGSSLMEQFPIYELMLDEELPYTIYNRGIGGYTTPELLEHIDTMIFDLEPAYVFINIGTNDLSDPNYSKEGLLSRYRTILESIMKRLPDTKIFVLAYYPGNPKFGDRIFYMKEIFRHRTNERILDANEGVKQLAVELGLTYLDLNEGLTDAEGNLREEFTIEGMHMYVDGYRVVLNNLLPVLKSL